jgi:TonB-dependent receptor
MLTGVLVFAQGTGKIAGTVTDGKTGETLIGVSVKLAGTNKGVGTDVDGKYVLGGLAPGKHTIEISYISYATKRITDVEVKANVVTSLNVVMEEASSTLKQVIITGSFKQESVNALYAQQKNSPSISDGISSDVIKKSPDRNTGEVLKRVSGASVQDNKFIIVRGLSDRYNSAMINNSPMPSSEPDRKTFSFDVIPSNLIDNVVISKTATPDLPGDFSGGAVQIKTKDFPEVRSFELNLGVGYNTVSTFKDFYGNSRPAINYLGFAGGDAKLPASFPSSKERYLQQPIARRIELSKQFKNTWGINRLGSALPSQSLQLIYGNSYRLANEGKLGFIASVTYRSAETISNEIRNDYNEVTESNQGLPLFEYTDKYYNFNASLGVLANIAYTKGSTKIALKNIYNQSYDESYLNRNGLYDVQSLQRVSQQEINEKSMLNSVLEGEHQLSSGNKSKLNWNLSFSQITNDQPDLRRLTYSKLITAPADEPYQAQVQRGATPSTAGRFFSELSENIYGAAVNYSLPVELLDNTQTLKVGLLKQYKDRNVNARVLGYVDNTSSADEARALLTLPQDQLFDPANIAVDKIFIDDITNPSNNYDGSGDLNAGYAMLTGTLAKKIKATVGLRVENYIEKLNTRTNAGKLDIENNYLDFLPSANLTFELTPKANLRASYSNTVARAQFRELAPFSFYDFVTGMVKIGNENIKRTKISNADLRYEFYPTAGQLISVSAFYKYLTNPIENNIISGSTAASKSMSYINAPNAFIAGAEFEVRHDLGFINESSGFLKRLIYSANAAYIKSEVDFGAASITIKNKRPLQGQSPYLINTGFQYSTEKSGWQGSILYNRIGRRIAVVGFGRNIDGEFLADYPDIYEAPRNLLDFQISKRIIKQRAELKLNVSNILDSDARFYQDVNDDGKYAMANDQLINSVQFGRSFSLSFSYKF